MTTTSNVSGSSSSIGLVERSLVYPGSLFHIITRMLEHMKQYDEYVSVDLIDLVLQRVHWAQQRGDQPIVAFLVFWKLYTTWTDFQDMVHDVEREYNPLQSTPRDLLDTRTYAIHMMEQLCSSAFMPCNIQQLLSNFQRHMDLALNLRVTSVLHSEPLDPVRVDKECPALDPVELLPTAQARAMARRMRRCVHVYGAELSSMELLDSGAPQQQYIHPLLSSGIQVPLVDPLLLQTPIL